MEGDDERIRERAYRIWEEEGRPEGREADHWALAREAIALEDAGGGALLPNPAADHPAEEEPAQAIEEAFIQENLGEFPTAYTDQGDRQQVPSATPAEAESSVAPAQKPVSQQVRARKPKTAAEPVEPTADPGAKPKPARRRADKPATGAATKA